MANPTHLTAEGKAALEAELKELIEVIEPDLVARVGDAAAQGDLRENFAYHDLRRELGIKRGRIQELRALLTSVVLVNTSSQKDGVVRLGATIVITEDGFDEKEEYAIVTEAEASNQTNNGGKAMLSVTSPLGQALVGHKQGEKVTFRAPTGIILKFVIVEVM